ncbi:MAG TPA: NYN domain-containing protein [bacterium]|nr:NYN domain-containing protein [bacterium]HPN67534.1 NYN domain-containing protein [bacterium]
MTSDFVNPYQRVSVFVDVQNMYHSAKNLYEARVNYEAILSQALRGRNLIRALAYVVESGADVEKGFFDALKKAGYEIKSKDLQIFAGGQKKADWDVGLAIDMIKMSPKVDCCVLVSGDGDYVPLIEYLQFLGLRVEVLSFKRSTSARLIEQADYFFDMDTEYQNFVKRIDKKSKK